MDIENRGSTARDHLANERTFLAWVRTALGLVGLGVVMERFATSAGVADAVWAKVGGASLIAFGGAALIYGLGRYRKVAARLAEGRFPIADRGPTAVGGFALIVAGVALLFVLIR